MPFGIDNSSVVTLQNLTDMGNSSSFAEFMINVNNIVYNGWYMFFMMLVFWVILYMAAQQFQDQPLNNIMYGGAIVTVLSFLLRGIFITQNGVIKGLITDFQLWIFPLVTISVAAIIWSIKD